MADEPLVLPQDEFELVRKVAESTGLARPLAEVQTALRLRIAEGKLADAEARLAEVRSVLLEGGQPDSMARRRALAIIGSEEETRGV